MHTEGAGIARSGTGGGLQPQRRKATLVSLLGLSQIFAWGTTFYLPAVLAGPISEDTGWSLAMVVAGLSWALLLAGSLAPRVGRTIDRHGGRAVLTASSVLIALGLSLLSRAEHLAVYFLAWSLIGAGMAAGLYDASFALLGRLYGAGARSAITGLTLFGGFASTLCWPLVAALEQALGWRDSCLVIAGGHLLLSAPLHYVIIPRHRSTASSQHQAAGAGKADLASASQPDRRFLLLCASFTLLAFVMSSLSVHLLEILRQSGIGAATAIAIGMLIGPAQVAGRVLEFTWGRRLHPVWSARGGSLLCFCGILLLTGADPHLAFLAAAVYGAGNGILTIARGTLPLSLFGSDGYGERMGLLARPMLFAQASAPILAAFCLQLYGADIVLVALTGLLAFGCVFLACLSGSSAGELRAETPPAATVSD